MWRSTLVLAGLLAACAPNGVGDPCTPEEMPAGGFVGGETYLETSTAQCRTRVCLVNGLDGDPGLPCTATHDPGCTTPDEVTSSVYCSCRCDGPPGSDLCACPDGFRCAPLLQHGPAGIIGSYCVRE